MLAHTPTLTQTQTGDGGSADGRVGGVRARGGGGGGADGRATIACE